ncbi:MAG: DUF1345 domain-containing protein [Acetobacteraceae bacterium]
MRESAARLGRIIAARPRLIAGALAGLAAFPLLLPHLSTGTAAIVAWDFGVGVFLASSFWLFWTEEAADIPANAAAQEEGEWSLFWITLGGILASFAAIVGIFARIDKLPPWQWSLSVVLVVATLLLSWLLTQTVFCFRYAHEYYAISEGAAAVDGGLEFPGHGAPDYLDFLYFSVVIGMTFQVSDVAITSRKLRRLALVHGVLGFLFNTNIIALTVNIASGLVQPSAPGG